jgi:hypothetical protein
VSETSNSSRTNRSDGRRQFLLYLNPELIMKIKLSALASQRPAYEVVEQILEQNLESLTISKTSE